VRTQRSSPWSCRPSTDSLVRKGPMLRRSGRPRSGRR
jgi:hypothetical protein